MFDFVSHLKNHAYMFAQHQKHYDDDLRIKFSFLDLQFLGRDKEKVMENFVADLKKPAIYNQKNGFRADGTQKFTNRIMDLGADIKMEAIHFKGIDGEDTMPHYHMTADKKVRFGRNYSFLKKHISEIASKHNLTPHFDVVTEHNPLFTQNLAKACTSLTWSWKKMTNEELKKDINARGLNGAIEKLSAYSLKTDNLTYYIKSLETVRTRLNRLRLDVQYQDHNLRDTYPIPLSSKDMEVIQFIQDKNFTQKEIKPYLKHPIFRDFIRHSAGTSTPFIINALKRQTHLLNGMMKNQTAVKNYVKLMERDTSLKKSQLTPANNKTLSQKNNLKANLLKVVQSVTNEKSLQLGMQKSGYTGFALKKSKGSVIGCIYVDNGKKKSINFIDISIKWSAIKRALISNATKEKNGEDLPKNSVIKANASPLKNIYIPKPMPKTVRIEYKIDTRKNYNKKKSKIRRMFESTIKRVKTRIAEFKSKIYTLEQVNRATEQIGASEEIKAEIRGLEDRRDKESRNPSEITDRRAELKADIEKARERNTEAKERHSNEHDNDWILKRNAELRNGIGDAKAEIALADARKSLNLKKERKKENPTKSRSRSGGMGY
jgi:hypothetical protein